MKNIPSLFLMICFSCSNDHSTPSSSSDTLGTAVALYPITRDTHNLFPSRMVISGTITESDRSSLCTDTCAAIYARIDLDKEPSGYPRGFAYVVFPCNAGTGNIRGKKVTIEVAKIMMDDTSCAFTKSTSIKSFGITPWYWAKE